MRRPPDQRELQAEAELIAAWRQGDSRAGEEIKQLCHARVRATAGDYFPGDAESQEEAVQGTWRRLFGSLHRFQGRCLLRTYAGVLARHECLDLKRRLRSERSRTVRLDEVEAATAGDGGDPAGPLWECLEALPEQWRRVLLARAEQPGKQCDDLAARLQMEVDEVYEMLYRARRAMRECLARKGMRGKTGEARRQGERGQG
ncbi:MAG: sigma-70 family RNA polymerase sigma factor [Armatimonadetes bacterium]|nr:sigma-70 family RNA polymerase sigma factor [Armatimonadota bacterium]